MRTTIARCLRGATFFRARLASSARKAWISAQYPEVTFSGKVFVAPRCVITAGRGASLTIRDCHISEGSTLTAAPGATLVVDADFVAHGVTIVAREEVRIGSGSQLGEFSSVRDHNHDRDLGVLHGFTTAPVRLGANTWLGARSAVLMGVTIGTNSTIGANAVVTRDIPEGSVAVGVPARLT
jgi:acetyltransferase-like isoleucine patch superfamily enzyme